MLLNGFQIEILVDGQPLEEYTLPIDELRSTTGSSYVLNDITGQKEFDNNATYVAAKPETKYSIKFSSTRASFWAPLMAYVYVDGEYDYTYRELLSPSSRDKDCFWNNTLTKKYYFKFEVSQLSEIDNPEIPLPRKPFGGLGAISIYFYKARVIPQRPVYIPNFEVNQVQVAESKSTRDIKFTTAFEEAEGFVNRQAVATMEKQSDEPVSVLHLHYRPALWLQLRGFDIPEVDQPNNLSSNISDSFKELKPYSFNIEEDLPRPPMKKTKYKIVKAPVVQSDNVIEIDSKEIIDLENYTPKKKRAYTKEIEVIELLDSDEEDEARPSKILRINN